MDAPPPQEDCRTFVRVAAYFESMQLNAPRVIEADVENGFLLLSDLGSQQYLDVLTNHRGEEHGLYADAIDALLTMQQRGVAYQGDLPLYDETLLRRELSLFKDWLCGTHLEMTFSDADEREWQRCCDVLTDNALAQPQVFVHRDYHSRNLMFVTDNNPGILDFQDAVAGPFTYDLVSLLKDCYVTWPIEQVRAWALQFYAGCDESLQEAVNELLFKRYFELMGLQRHLKAAGIFCRLSHRDGKSSYLQDVPRTLAYISPLRPDYPELRFLFDVVADIEQRWEASR